jgi:Flp pilus assembly protein TadD
MVPHVELGTRYARRSEWDAARRELSAVARLAPYYSESLVELAAVAAEQGDFVEARARIAQVLALEPAHRGALELRAKVDKANPPP